MNWWRAVAKAVRLFFSKPNPVPKSFRLTVYLSDADTGDALTGLVTIDGPLPQSKPCVRSVSFDVPTDGFVGMNVTADVDGYEHGWTPIPRPVDQSVVMPLIPVPAPPAPDPVLTTGEHLPLYVSGNAMLRSDGTVFPYRAASWFAGFHRFAVGQPIDDMLDEWVNLGANALRVFFTYDRFGIGSASGLGECSPRTIPGFYEKVPAFVRALADRGLFVVCVYCADFDARSDGSGGLMTNPADIQAHITRMDAALADCWNVLVQCANEPFKNLEEVAHYAVNSQHPRDYGIETVERGQGSMPHLDWVGKHDHERTDDWPRNARSIDELRGGFGWGLTDEERSAHPDWQEDFGGTHTPVAWDEPMGFAEVERPGARVTSPDDAAYGAATAALMGMGSCFHSDDGVAARLLGPVQKAAATEWFKAARWVPVEAQFSAYQRGGRGGGAGIGNMPIEHHDLDEGVEPAALRTFCKVVNGAEYCVRIRPVGPNVPRDGWRVTDEPRPGLVKLER